MNLQVRSLSHTFAGRPPLAALDRVSFAVTSGQFVAVIGPSGCGKSTLLRLIAGLLPSQGGDVSLQGLSPAEALAGHRTAWLAQSPALLPWLTVEKNVALAHRFCTGAARPRLHPREALERVGLGDVAGAYPAMLSGGMQQRLALARLLSLDASLWLMDEPFAALDELTRERLAQDLLELWQPLRPTVLWVTHNIYEALRLADRVLVFSCRPARLVSDIVLDLPRPRREDSPAFQGLLTGLRAALNGAGGAW